MKKMMKKATSVFLAVILAVFATAPCFSAISYPEDITEQKALKAVETTDRLIFNLLKSTQNTTLKELLKKELYSDKMLNQLLPGIYGMFGEYESDLASINMDISVKAVAQDLYAYPEIAAELSAYDSWSQVNELSGSWGVSEKEGFCKAVSAALTPFNDILYTLLCSGSYRLNSVIGIKGGKGYENAILPLLQALGCTVLTDKATFCSEAEADKGTMVYNLVSDLLFFVEYITEAPMERITAILPGIALFFENGGFDKAVSKLIEPLTLQLGSITTFIKIEPLISFIADPSSMTAQLDINSMLSATGFKTAPIDMKELASCGTVSGNTVTADKGACFVLLLRWLIETAKLNGDNLSELLNTDKMAGGEIDFEKLMKDMLSKDTDELVSTVIGLFSAESGKVNEYQWTYGEFSPVTIEYTQNLGQEKYQRVLEGIDDLIDEFVAESGEYKTLEKMLFAELYSSKTLTTLLSTVFGLFENEELKEISALLPVDTMPSQVAARLVSGKYASARSALYSSRSWSEVLKKNISWGFKDGDWKGFRDALCTALEGLEPLVAMLLAEGKAEIMGIEIYGSNGYNTAVIPLFEAMGCKAKTIDSYSEYKKQAEKGNALEPLVTTICKFINRFAEKPVYTLTEIAPNLIWFVENGGLAVCVDNLLYPFKELMELFGMQELIDLSALENVNINELASKLLSEADLGMKLTEPDFSKLGKVGQLKTMESKRTFNGEPVTISYVEADKTGVLMCILRFFVGIMKTPGNESMMTSFMGSSGGENDMFATYSSGIGDEMAAMTTDETVEWLYKIFFRERAVKEIKPADDYLPTIIYEKKEVDTTARNFAAIMLVLVAFELLMIRNRRSLDRMASDRKIKKRLKEEYENRNEQEA